MHPLPRHPGRRDVHPANRLSKGSIDTGRNCPAIDDPISEPPQGMDEVRWPSSIINLDLAESLPLTSLPRGENGNECLILGVIHRERFREVGHEDIATVEGFPFNEECFHSSPSRLTLTVNVAGISW